MLIPLYSTNLRGEGEDSKHQVYYESRVTTNMFFLLPAWVKSVYDTWQADLTLISFISTNAEPTSTPSPSRCSSIMKFVSVMREHHKFLAVIGSGIHHISWNCGYWNSILNPGYFHLHAPTWGNSMNPNKVQTDYWWNNGMPCETGDGPTTEFWRYGS